MRVTTKVREVHQSGLIATNVDFILCPTCICMKATRNKCLNSLLVLFLLQTMLEQSQKQGERISWGGPDEEDRRDLMISMLQRSVIDSVDHLKLATQEIPMLEMRQQHQKGELTFPEEDKKPPPKPFIMSIKSVDELRQLYQDRVFKPPHELPSMTLDELADYEIKLMRDREESKKNADRQRELKDSLMTQDEKEEAEDKKARDWDDWTDDNPKGWGNRNRNVG
eukprot:Selendium_serpulae@DN5931_c0_g1_i2.p1